MVATLSDMTNRARRKGVPPASPGRAIAARRNYLGLTQPDVVDATNNVINGSLLSRLETDRKSPASLSITKYNALVKVLRWTHAEFEEATGAAPATSDVPGAIPYRPGIQVPIVGTVSAGLRHFGGDTEGMDTIPVDLNAAGLEHANTNDLVWLQVNGDSMISESAATNIPHGAMVLVEVGAIPRNRDVVVAWLENRETAVLKQYREESNVILRSYNPAGPVFRLSDEPVDVRGVVRLVQFRLGG